MRNDYGKDCDAQHFGAAQDKKDSLLDISH